MSSKVIQSYFNFDEHEVVFYIVRNYYCVANYLFFCTFYSEPKDNPEKQKWLSLQSQLMF
jgi:hypothetical protein